MDRNFKLTDFYESLSVPNNRSMTEEASFQDGTKEIEMLCPRCGHITSNTFVAYTGFDPVPHMESGPHISTGNDDPSKFGSIDNHYSLLVISRCHTCRESSLWFETTKNEKLLLPRNSASIEAPSIDMPDDVRADYDEASEIFDQSPRASAALLRLATQKLVDQLVAGTKDLNKKIGNLVSDGLSPLVQRSLDSLRVIGNNAVHPGTIDLNDDRETAASLFKLLNFIVDQTITQPKQINQIFDNLPQGAKDAVDKRDNK